MEAVAERLAAVRQQMMQHNLDALVVPRADEYLGEYIPERNERLHWVSGFTGSAGVCIILRDRAAIFVDGRYTVQVRQQVDTEHFDILHLMQNPHLPWLVEQLDSGARVGFDSRTHAYDWYQRAQRLLGKSALELVAVDDNLVDASWLDRPAPQVHQALLLDAAYTGLSSTDKRAQIGAAVAAAGADAAYIFAADSVAWLLNIRGRDVPCLPLVLGSALLHGDGRLVFFTNPEKIPDGFAGHVGGGVQVCAEADAAATLAGLGGQRVLIDPQTANAWSHLVLREAGAELVTGADPVLLPKACKNPVELQGMRNAHIRDAVAEVSFLSWLDAEVAAGRLHDEAVLSDQLFECRARQALFQETSFDTISAAGPNAAICHYHHLNGTPAQLTMDSVYLVDSGGQYLDGTTDITRTVAIGDPGDEVRRMNTLVLKGHIALAVARFPQGTTGTQLDSLARQFLWREGFDYDHGTGHGVGCFLSVHEGPQRIAKSSNDIALQPGMVISNEPGYYRAHDFGMRCENLVAVRELPERHEGEPLMLGFEMLTLVPFDTRLLDRDLMDEQEVAWLNDYHAQVRDSIGPALAGSELAWLDQATQVI
jgi:Xaa-Pro aminopeptidase